MKSIFHSLATRVILLLLLALATLIAAETPAWAFFISHSNLQARCAAGGGNFSSSASGHSYFCQKGDGAVVCSDYKHKICATMAEGTPPKSIFGIALGSDDTAMVTIPCDPIFCKIYCGGRPSCTFGNVFLEAMPAKVDDPSPPPSLVTPVIGGSNGGPAPAGVPVLE
jgi:hypothetical protein